MRKDEVGFGYILSATVIRASCHSFMLILYIAYFHSCHLVSLLGLEIRVGNTWKNTLKELLCFVIRLLLVYFSLLFIHVFNFCNPKRLYAIQSVAFFISLMNHIFCCLNNGL